jgi:aminotransferase
MGEGEWEENGKRGTGRLTPMRETTAVRKLRLSNRSADVVKSEIRSMSVECARVGGINLSQGVCDTPVPDVIARVVDEGIQKGFNSYTRHDGIAELRTAIARKLERDNAISADPETQIVVSGGSTGAFYCACLALLDPGDAVVLFEPYYGYHMNTLLALDLQPSLVPMQAPDWEFSEAALEQAITPRTRAILINTPGNPSGKVFTRAEIEMIGRVAARHDLFILTDEIYEYFVFDGRSHVSPASVPGMAERTITISGFSKTYSITGWRIGYAAAAPQWAEAIGHYNDLVYVCAPAPLQYAVSRGLDALDRAYYDALAVEYQAKRDRICAALADAGLRPVPPQGAYYVMADVSALPGSSSKERAMYLLRQTGVASVPGSAFYQDGRGEQYVRFCFAKKDAELDEACRRLRRNKK